LRLRADQIEMQNGDRYVGTVLSLNANTLVLHSEVLGDLTLPRSKVALITLRPVAVTNLVSTLPASTNSRPRALSVTRTNAAAEELPTGFRLLAANSNLVEKVTAPFLDGAGPEAKAKFQELFGGLVSGSLTVEDVRGQARSAVEQLKELKRDGGDETGLLDGYLTILEKFLGEPSPSSGSATNASTSRAKP
jgi:hypothetical protein